MGLAYLLAFLPLGAALVLKAHRIGASVATLLSLAIVTGVTARFYLLFGIGQGNPTLPIAVGCLIGGICLLVGLGMFFDTNGRT